MNFISPELFVVAFILTQCFQAVGGQCKWPFFCTIYLDAEAMHFSTWNENGKLNEDTQPLIIQRSGVNIGLKASAVRRNKNKQRHQGKKWKKRTFNLY